MNTIEHHKLKKLIKKYNPVLRESIENALTEDLFNLIIVNVDDKGEDKFAIPKLGMGTTPFKENKIMKTQIKMREKKMTIS